MDFVLDIEQEDDGRWIAEIAELPGVMAYGATPAQASAQALRRPESGHAVANRLEYQASGWFAQATCSFRLAGFSFAFHDKEETARKCLRV